MLYSAACTSFSLSNNCLGSPAIFNPRPLRTSKNISPNSSRQPLKLALPDPHSSVAIPTCRKLHKPLPRSAAKFGKCAIVVPRLIFATTLVRAKVACSLRGTETLTNLAGAVSEICALGTFIGFVVTQPASKPRTMRTVVRLAKPTHGILLPFSTRKADFIFHNPSRRQLFRSSVRRAPYVN